MDSFKQQLRQSRERSWKTFGKEITFYLPGMFRYDNMTGNYPALSITGGDCSLMCDHCKGKLLHTMVQAPSPDDLVAQCLRLERNGAVGVLLSGGCNTEGQLPWERFLKAVEAIKSGTGLIISAHTGFVDANRALELKSAGIDQALIDVIGDRQTYKTIYHLDDGPERLMESLNALGKAEIEIVPHIVCGLHLGSCVGEKRALKLLVPFGIKKLVMVSLMRIPGTPAASCRLPLPQDIARLIVEARTRLPDARISLGCARQRGNSELEVLAVQAGVNAMALPSEQAIHQARKFNLNIRYQKTCCSVSADFSTLAWN